jgi:hypothetical protein
MRVLVCRKARITVGDVLGFVGTIVGSYMNAQAQKKVTRMQLDALEKARQFVFDNLDPANINQQAMMADLDNARNRLKAQAELDPELLASRYEAEGRIREQAAELGITSKAVQDQAVAEALGGGGTAAQGKQALIDAALEQLQAGATLPSDVQAELVKAGLERSGMVTGAATPKGVGGQITRQLLGTAGLQLQQQRQQQAAALLGQAQNLESARAGILGNLFPNLASTQLNLLGGQQSVLQQSNAIMPNAGLSGNDIANLWLARVGATTSLNRDSANVAARGAQGVAQAWQPAIGAASNFAANALPTFSSAIGGGGGGGSVGNFDPNWGQL